MANLKYRRRFAGVGAATESRFLLIDRQHLVDLAGAIALKMLAQGIHPYFA